MLDLVVSCSGAGIGESPISAKESHANSAFPSPTSSGGGYTANAALLDATKQAMMRRTKCLSSAGRRCLVERGIDVTSGHVSLTGLLLTIGGPASFAVNGSGNARSRV